MKTEKITFRLSNPDGSWSRPYTFDRNVPEPQLRKRYSSGKVNVELARLCGAHHDPALFRRVDGFRTEYVPIAGRFSGYP